MEGQVVEFDVAITAYHKGRFSFRVCRINGKGNLREQADLTEDCLNKNILVSREFFYSLDELHHQGANRDAANTHQCRGIASLTCISSGLYAVPQLPVIY